MAEGGEGEQLPIEKSVNTYALPYPPGTQVSGMELDGPAHQGPYRGAIDYLMPLGTKVLAPLEGTVLEVVDYQSEFGPTKYDIPYLNFITLQHSNGERSQVAHLAKSSSRVKEDDIVKKGQVLAVTGESGMMTEPHLHFIVFKLEKSEFGFRGVEPQFEAPEVNRPSLLKRAFGKSKH